MEPIQLRKLLKKYLLGKASGEEKKQVTQWYEALGESESPMYLSPTQREEMTRKLWTGVQARTAEAGQPIPERVQSEKKPGKWQWLETVYWVITIAGVITVIGLLLWSFSVDPVKPPVTQAAFGEKINNTGTPLRVMLEDSTLVWLQPGSTLRYPDTFALRQREVLLQGAASFQVSPDEKRPFRVYSGQLVVRTSASGFTIKVHESAQTTEVIIQTGQAVVFSQPAFRLQSSDREGEKTTVSQPEESGVLLTPGQKAMFYPVGSRIVKMEAEAGDQGSRH